MEGSSLAHDNPLLYRRTLLVDSFSTADALFDAAATGLPGEHAHLLHAVPAPLETLAVVASARLATANDRAGSPTVSLPVVGAMLAFPATAWAQFYLAGPHHVDTVLFSLAAFELCAVRPSPRRYVAACALPAAGQGAALGIGTYLVASAQPPAQPAGALVALLRADHLHACLGGH